MMKASVRVLLADDHPVVRDGLAAILNAQSGIEVVGVAADGPQAVDLYRKLLPDVAIVDLRMPGMDGAEVAACLRAEYPEARVVILSTFDSEHDVFRALQSGARGYLVKDAPVQCIIDCLLVVKSGRRHIPQAIANKLAAQLMVEPLSTREQHVLAEIVKGKSNLEIGETLGISEGTVKFHVNNILGKLNVTDRTQAVIAALKRGIAQL